MYYLQQGQFLNVEMFKLKSKILSMLFLMAKK